MLRRRTASNTAVRRRPNAFDLLLTSAALEYPDPATFLSRMLTVAMPRAWLPNTTLTAVLRLRPLLGSARDRAATHLAVRLAEHDAPVASLATSRSDNSSPPTCPAASRRASASIWRRYASASCRACGLGERG
jgi:hypothetical protein